MKKIKFSKMEGAGNDYVYVNLFEEILANPEKLAIDMSKRSFGVGADGLVLIGPSRTADLQMVMFNADGSRAEMCGNAIRCVGKYAWDYHLVKSKSIRIETDAGIKDLDLNLDETGLVDTAIVKMGIPELNAKLIPSTLHGDKIVDHSFEFENIKLEGTLVSMGNPHFVTFVEDVQKVPVDKWGPVIEHSALFPHGINVEFVQVISAKEVMQRTWERGSGETWACGTGASAVCVAGSLTGRTDATILNHLTGGDLIITWEGSGHQVIMEGPAREVFSGIWKTDQ